MLQFYYLYYITTNNSPFIANHPQGDRAIGTSEGQNQAFWTSLPHHQQQQQFTNSGRLRFLQRSRMFIAPLLQFTCTEHTATDNIEVHASLQNFGFSVLTCFHGILLAPKEEKALFIFKGKYLEEYMVLNMKMQNGKLGRIEN
jgi:hypothetical protein